MHMYIYPAAMASYQVICMCKIVPYMGAAIRGRVHTQLQVPRMMSCKNATILVVDVIAVDSCIGDAVTGL